VIKIIICADGLYDTGRKEAVCHIVCAGGFSGVLTGLNPGDYIIAADGGLRHLANMGVNPDLIVGDFDSLGYVPKTGEIVKLAEEKDDTDTLAAVRIGLKKGFRLFYLHCGLGGRLDHTLANIQTLAFIARSGGTGLLFGEAEAVVIVKDEVRFHPGFSGNISVFSYSGKAGGVDIEGLKYGLKNAVLTNAFPIGVSNEFIGIESRISVHNGILLIVYERKNFITNSFHFSTQGINK